MLLISTAEGKDVDTCPFKSRNVKRREISKGGGVGVSVNVDVVVDY